MEKWLACPTDHNHSAFKNLRSTVQRDLRTMQNDWWNNLADEMQEFADKHDSKNFYCALRRAYGAKPSSTNCIKSADGDSLLKDPTAILDRWKDYFGELLNRPSVIDSDSLDLLPQYPVVPDLGVVPEVHEISSAIRRLKNGKAPGPDGLPPEVFIAALVPLSHKLQPLFAAI